jgi:hypothetical protein
MQGDDRAAASGRDAPEDDGLTPSDENGRGWRAMSPDGALVGIFVLGVVTSLVVVLAWGVVTGGDDDPSSAQGDLARQSEVLDSETPDPTPLDTGAAPSARPATTRLSRCASAARSLESALGAARPALDQWTVHIGAMNKLVVGEITLQQATAFWERTRVGAQRRVEDFRDAMDVLRRRGLDCPSPGLLAPGARALPGCARQVEAEVRVLRTAWKSIDMWEHHVHQMDMLRLGEITPEQATQAWLTMWQQGDRDLDAYRAAARAARPLDECTGVGSAE